MHASMHPSIHPSVPTFGHLDETAVFCRILVLQQRSFFSFLLRCALLWALQQRTRQKPKGNGRQQGDEPGYEVAQPPGPHPSSVCRGDGDAICIGRRGSGKCMCNSQIHLNGIKQGCEVGEGQPLYKYLVGKHVYD